VSARTPFALAGALCLLLVAACGEEGDSGATATQATSTAASTTTAPAEEETQPEEPAASFDAFVTPSQNIACAYSEEAGVLRCDILSGLSPPPEGACELDWTGVVIGQGGPADPQCAGDTVYSNELPVLGYGEEWARSSIRCASDETGLECSNGEGHSLFLSRESWRAD
jgi:hypothetical protein